jgi:hypothetical protein
LSRYVFVVDTQSEGDIQGVIRIKCAGRNNFNLKNI